MRGKEKNLCSEAYSKGNSGVMKPMGITRCVLS